MMFHGVDTDTLRSVELAAQINQLKEMTRGGYDILPAYKQAVEYKVKYVGEIR